MSFRRSLPLILALIAVATGLRADTPPLLAAAIANWSTGKQDWAFTQRTRELTDDGEVKQERLERYDPSLPDARRWQLLAVDGRPPTPDDRRRWETPRNRKPRKHANKPPQALFDFQHAVLLEQTPAVARYEVAMRPEAARLVDLEKLDIEITVDRRTRTIQRVTATLREPMRVALGLAHITDVDLDVHFDPSAPATTPGDVEANGVARVQLSKLGQRAEYAWSDFERVTPYPRRSAAGAD